MDKIVVKTILVTLGAAFLLLSVNEWKKLADQIPADDGTMNYVALPSADSINSPVCMAVAPAAKTGNQSLKMCEAAVGSHVPWTQGIKAFVYSWIGIGLLVAAFIKGKGVSGGYW